MNLSPLFRTALLACASTAALAAGPAFAQEQAPRPAENTEQDSAAPAPTPAPDPETLDGANGATSGGIVVQGQRLRGQLDVEQDPILELDEADIAAEGVTSIADLITQITDQSGSNRGRGSGRPIILINGIRIGSFREIQNYPPEALERLEVFPEEVAQRFGFAPDRRVINLILKENYRNAEVEFEFEGPSRGGYHQREQELGYLQIANGARINVNLEASDTSFLTEDERDIIQTTGSVSDVAGDPDQAPFRSLVTDSRSLEGNISWAKAFIESGTSVSANANYARSDSRSLQGLNSVILTDAAGDSVLRTFGEETPLEQRTSTDTFSTSGSLTKPVNAFRLTSTFNASLAETTQEFDRRFDTAGLQADALSGAIALDADLPSEFDAGFDTALTQNIAASSLTTLRGPVADLPGGEVLATFDLGYNWTNLESSDTRGNTSIDLTRGAISTGMNLVVPITSRRTGFADALGSFTFNAQIGLEHLSDFGTLGDYTLGLNWKPFDNLDLSANYITRDVAPDLTSLGNPRIETENVSVFDFVNGETVLATVTTGGNADLLAETQRDWKFAANWQLPFWEGARFTVEYVRNRSSDVTSGFPTITEEIEGAFPDRITRDADGTLTAVDRRFVTFSETRADRLNLGLFFRGSIGAGQQTGGRPGGGRPGGRPQGASPAQSGPPQRGAAAGGAQAGAQAAPQGTQADRRGDGPPTAEQRAAFAEFRTRICADDGLEVLKRLIEANANGEDLSAAIPGFDAQRFERLLARVRDENGEISPERLARVRERICSFDPGEGPRRGSGPSGTGEPSEPGSPGRSRGGPGGEGFAAFRALVCADDGAEQIRALIARIEAGEDVSDELPGFDPQMGGRMIDRLRDPDGNVSDERIARLRSRFCADGQSQGGDQGSGQAQGQASGGPPAGFNPLARRSFPGFRYFVSANHTIELTNDILIAPGLDRLDQLDGQSTSAFGLPRHSSRLEAGIFGQGVGMRMSARYTGETRLDGGTAEGDIFFGDLATFDLRVFAEVGQLVGRNDGLLKNFRIALRADNVFDAQRRVVDANGDTPLNYQPFLIDPVGRFIGVDIRKLF